jgi:hypothetical protein
MEWTANRKHKDQLFIRLFGYEDMKENALSLYNALHGTSYESADDMEVYTIEDAVYIHAKNDVAYLVDQRFLTLWEQQSTYNPNMPLRGLLYFSDLYNKYIRKNRLNLYGKKLVKIPTPQYVVFYNGIEHRPAVEELKLSDSFIQPIAAGKFEWTATVYNLNKNVNGTLLGQCKPLADYMELINRIRANQNQFETLEEAVDSAVESCIKDDILADFLSGHRAEAINMCIIEFDKEIYERDLREEGILIGRKEGISIGRKEGVSIGRKEGVSIGRKEGVSIGRKEGREEQKKINIEFMLRNGKSPEEISNFCGFDLDYVKEVEASLLANV